MNEQEFNELRQQWLRDRARLETRIIEQRRLIDEKPAWTLIIRGPYVRTWGFWSDRGWESFKDYFVRRGC